VLFSIQSVEGHLFDLLDEDGNVVLKVTLETLAPVAD